MTITRTGKPGLMVIVGWMLSERLTTCWPVWLTLCDTPLLDGLGQRAVVVAAHAGFGADAQERREDRRLEQRAPVVVDLVLEAGIAFGIGAGLTLEHDRAAVRHDQAIPDEQRARLAKGDLRVVLPDQARALRDQKDLSRRAVIDIFRHLCGDLAGQVGAQAGDQRGGDHRARLQNVFAGRRLDAVRAGGAPIDGAVEKSELVILRREVGRSAVCGRRRRVRRPVSAQRRFAVWPTFVVAKRRLDPRRLLLLRNALLLGIGRRPACPAPGRPH